MRTQVLLAVVVLGAGCNTAETVRQSALVPRPHADTYDGQPMTKSLEIEGHASGTVASASTGNDASSGATINRYEAGGEMRFAAGHDGEVAIQFDDALRQGATSANAQNPVDPSEQNSYGLGASFRRSVPLGEPGDPEGWRLGVDGTFTFWSIAREERDDGPHSDLSATAALSLVPSKRMGNIVLFGNATITNQIDAPATYVEATGNDQGTSPTHANGRGVGILGVGAKFEISDSLAFVGTLAETINAQGSDLPMLALSLVIAPGRRRDAPPLYGPPPPMVQPLYPPPGPQPQYPNPQYPNPQYPNPQYPNPQYPNPQYPAPQQQAPQPAPAEPAPQPEYPAPQ